MKRKEFIERANYNSALWSAWGTNVVWGKTKTKFFLQVEHPSGRDISPRIYFKKHRYMLKFIIKNRLWYNCENNNLMKLSTD